MSRVKIKDAPFSFNRSIRIGSRRERITGDSGALTGCELPRRSKVLRFLAKRQSQGEPNHGTKSRKFNRDCTICPSCRWRASGFGRLRIAGMQW